MLAVPMLVKLGLNTKIATIVDNNLKTKKYLKCHTQTFWIPLNYPSFHLASFADI